MATGSRLSIRMAVAVVLLAGLALVPVLSALAGQSYYVTLFTRIVILAIAAVGLNLILGFGGLVSFGHAMYVGVGAYAVGILSFYGIGNGWLHLAAGLGVGAVVACIVGFVCLRTSGIAFIMITLAFAQMLFYLSNSIKAYGGDEGLNIRTRSLIALPGLVLDLKNDRVLYYVTLAVLAAMLLALARFVPSRFGRAVRALRDDDVRAEALGFPTYRYKLIVFVVAGACGGIAGALYVNLTGYVSPNLLHWTQSGTLMVMVILGGVASVWGGLAGAAVLLLLQEVLSATTGHWEFWTGWVLLAVVLFARHGLVGLRAQRREGKP